MQLVATLFSLLSVCANSTSGYWYSFFSFSFFNDQLRHFSKHLEVQLGVWLYDLLLHFVLDFVFSLERILGLRNMSFGL